MVVIIMKASATTAETSAVIARVEDLNLKVHLSEGDERTIIGLIGDSRLLDHEVIERMSGVDRVVPVLKPFKLAGRDFKPKDTRFAIGTIPWGRRVVTDGRPVSGRAAARYWRRPGQ